MKLVDKLDKATPGSTAPSARTLNAIVTDIPTLALPVVPPSNSSALRTPNPRTTPRTRTPANAVAAASPDGREAGVQDADRAAKAAKAPAVWEKPPRRAAAAAAEKYVGGPWNGRDSENFAVLLSLSS